MKTFKYIDMNVNDYISIFYPKVEKYPAFKAKKLR